MPSKPSETGETPRRWVIYRTQSHTTVYTGIEAETRIDAIDAFRSGAGDLQHEREQWSEWIIDAVEVAL